VIIKAVKNELLQSYVNKELCITNDTFKALIIVLNEFQEKKRSYTGLMEGSLANSWSL